MRDLDRKGWEFFPFDDALATWVAIVAPEARSCASDAEFQRRWLRHGQTWFAGVNVLPNDAEGRVGGSGPLPGLAVEVAEALYGKLPWDAGQVSVVYPGYPKRDVSESEASHRYRLRRDAAHVDGLLPEGPGRRRFIREPHSFILGIPFTACGAGASPMVVWEGSHEIIRQALCGKLAGHDPMKWSDADVTDTYHAARRQIFSTCRRTELSAKPGEAYLIHRLALHGVAPWSDWATAPSEGRGVLYFRPELPGGVEKWLNKG